MNLNAVGSNKIILAVDDDSTNRQVLKNFLVPMGYQVIECENGFDAIKVVNEALKPDIILMDVNMPGMSGYEACRKIREILPFHAYPILFVTAKLEERDLVEAINAGGNDYIRKPFSKGELLARISVHLSISNLTKAQSQFIQERKLAWLNCKSVTEVKVGMNAQHQMTALFLDMAGFTNLAETMTSIDLIKFVNSFLGNLAPFIHSHGGVVDKYIGDGILGLFSSPHDALLAGLAIAKAQKDYNEIHRSGGKRALIETRIGINSGSVSFGAIGFDGKIEMTALGDAINVASRLEGLARIMGASILITEKTFEESNLKSTASYRKLGPIQVRGKDQPISIIEVIDGVDQDLSHFKMIYKNEFEKSVAFYHAGLISESKMGFLSLIDKYPSDKACLYFLNLCNIYLQSAVKKAS